MTAVSKRIFSRSGAKRTQITSIKIVQPRPSHNAWEGLSRFRKEVIRESSNHLRLVWKALGRKGGETTAARSTRYHPFHLSCLPQTRFWESSNPRNYLTKPQQIAMKRRL
jgi:hypothetical protein